MSKAAELKKQIQILAGTYDKDIVSIEVATINSVDLTNWSCTATPVSGLATTPITDIMLTAEPSSNGFVLVPAVGSNVILAITLRNDIYVLMTSEVDQFIFYRDNGNATFHSFVIDNDGITTGDGTFGGMVKLVDPVDPTAGVLARLNALESFVGTLKTAMAGWIPVPGDGGAALKVALIAWLATITPSTTRTQLENTTFNQGNPLT